MTKTLIAVDCDPQCSARAAVDSLYEQFQQEADAIGSPYDDTGQLAERIRERNLLADRYLGANTLRILGQTCNHACSIERFAIDYANGAIHFGEEVEVVINSIKDK